MLKILLKFWPAITPIVLFGLWYALSRKKKETPKLSEKEAALWRWTLLFSIVAAFCCLLWIALATEKNVNGEYVPPSYQGGKIIPGHVENK